LQFLLHLPFEAGFFRNIFGKTHWRQVFVIFAGVLQAKTPPSKIGNQKRLDRFMSFLWHMSAWSAPPAVKETANVA